MDYLVNTPIEYLKGVGTERGSLLRSEAKIDKLWDLLNYFPFRYVNRSNYVNIRELPNYEGQSVQLKGTIMGVREMGTGRGKRLQASFRDQSGVIDLVWFKGAKWIKNKLTPGVLFRVYGKPTRFGSKWNIAHPEITPFEQVAQEKGLQAVYNSTEKLTKKGLHSKGIERLTYQLASTTKGQINEILPKEILEQYNLISREEAYYHIHVPRKAEDVQKAQFRIKFEELFFLQLELLLRKNANTEKTKGFKFEQTGPYFDEFYQNHIPFELTNAQKRVVKEIRKDLRKGIHMNRLLQGDVGSGKTLVALLSMLFGIGNGFQSALMAPTEILAQQHYKTIAELLEPLAINVALLTGSTKKSERKVLFEALEKGEIHILIGTHALLEPTVNFHNLGLVVIDEQHRFGVAQRARLWKKNTKPPHILVMTATPIPRTLAMTFYGDLDVSVIDELPPGRKPITTMHFFEKSRLKVFELIKKEIALGRQIYIVYPLIQESETLDYNNLMEGYESISRSFPRPDYQISIVHGQMKPEDKAFEMDQFAKGNTNIMVATTVIEVGVNVPNASVMIIESTERFGLSQLHQLRGRVGRGAEKSYCILMTGEKLSQEGKKRVQTMVSTNDGFKIAEVDLEIRGPGDIMGTQQSGILNLNLANLATDGQVLSLARDAAKTILNEDPKIKLEKHRLLRQEVKRQLKSKPNWSKIS
ncbi:ATP-dependent DNA helicase RecG [Brumimicrobium aurantiacum]|uniref:ATP-dependent DNA helicase RecG n=1 Tax=Brumimicrobium aurantiacum TaxID=1737063 RepID=A0A3E1F0Q3_9FLAO|nr:ATP-dependent DNA helicase RecG [Brumimicrobium aurantiacum]RFC55388.1 ATP-dependent DNA helicase RecG [Brumimicrobium aurantiacum]